MIIFHFYKIQSLFHISAKLKVYFNVKMVKFGFHHFGATHEQTWNQPSNKDWPHRISS
jgi:hypothetical protein